MKGEKRYLFGLGGGSYVVVTTKENPERDVTVRRGEVYTQADVDKLSDASKRDLDRWLGTGEVEVLQAAPSGGKE